MIVRQALIAAGSLLLLASPAQAYVDPGTGTFLIQILAAFFFGALFYLRRIRDFFLRLVLPRKRGESGADERK